MLNQNLSSILDKGISRYSLVTATAKRARQIAEKNLEENIITTEKPVSDDKKAARKRTATARKTASSKKATDANDIE